MSSVTSFGLCLPFAMPVRRITIPRSSGIVPSKQRRTRQRERSAKKSAPPVLSLSASRGISSNVPTSLDASIRMPNIQSASIDDMDEGMNATGTSSRVAPEPIVRACRRTRKEVEFSWSKYRRVLRFAENMLEAVSRTVDHPE